MYSIRCEKPIWFLTSNHSPSSPVLFLCFTIRVACRRHRLIHSISSSSFSRPQSLVSLPPWLSAKFVASFYVTDIQVHGTIDDFVTMNDKVHSKAIIKMQSNSHHGAKLQLSGCNSIFFGFNLTYLLTINSPFSIEIQYSKTAYLYSLSVYLCSFRHYLPPLFVKIKPFN